MLNEALSALDLDEKEIQVYLRLLRMGPSRASTLAYQLELPRTTVQNILMRLEQENVVSKTVEGNVFLFTPARPEELLEILEMRRKRKNFEAIQAQENLQKIMPELLGMMHSSKHIPQVHFFRGREGVRKVLNDTLNSKTEIKDFANIDAMFELIKDINDDYVAKREKTTVTKRSLLLETPFAHKVYESGGYSPKSHKGYKWVPSDKYFFSIEMNIYDGKVSYLTYVENDLIGVIIENHHIYQMHDSIWNLLWDTLPSPSKNG